MMESMEIDPVQDMNILIVDSITRSQQPGHLNEHCYSKLASDDNPLPMDTTPNIPSEERTDLSLLNQDKDTFETVLLQLLQTFTELQRKSKQDESPGLLPMTGLPGTMDISTQALSSLSHEQILSIVTSTSVNNEVVKQIQAQRQIKVKSEADVQQLLQLTPNQFQELQSQMTGLMNEGKVTIPSDLPPEQQMEFIKTLLVQQINTPKVNEQQSAAKKAKPTKLSGKVVSQLKRKPKEPQRPPQPYNIFFGEIYSTITTSNPKITIPEASKIITSIWEAMTDDVKKGYFERHEKMEQVYQQELIAYTAAYQTEVSFESTTDDHVSSPTGHMTPIDIAPLKTEPGIRNDKTVHNIQGIAASALVNIDKILNSAMTDTKGLCVNSGCRNKAVFSEERGPLYCSNQCVVDHCRAEFEIWVIRKKIKG